MVWIDGDEDDVEPAVSALIQVVEEADRLATLIYGLRDIHHNFDGYCNACGGNYPCATIRLATQLSPTEVSS